MTDWDIGDEDIWRLAVLILELPKENSSQPGSKDSRYWLGLLRPVLDRRGRWRLIVSGRQASKACGMLL